MISPAYSFSGKGPNLFCRNNVINRIHFPPQKLSWTVAKCQSLLRSTLFDELFLLKVVQSLSNRDAAYRIVFCYSLLCW